MAKSGEGLIKLLSQISVIFDVDPVDVIEGSRDKRLVSVKHVFSIVAKHRKYNYSEIAEFLGIHHSSVQYYCKDRPKSSKEEKVIHIFTDNSELIRMTAEKLADNPDDDYLKKQMLRLLTNEL